MLKPDDNWRWYFDAEHDRMMLELSRQMLFRSRFPGKMLANQAFDSVIFNVEDVRYFYLFDENCAILPLNYEQRAELVLNGLIAQRFLKPLLPKSWFFRQQADTFIPEEGQIIAVTSLDTGENIFFLVVDVGELASVCVLAQVSCNLSGKVIRLGDVIKIMNDRLIAITTSYQSEETFIPQAI